MKNNTLKTIQIFVKVAKVLSIIVFVCCLIGGIGSALGIITLALIPEGFQIGDITFKSFVEETAHTTIGTCYATMAASIIICAGEAVLSKFAEKYFNHELEIGEPFSFDVAKEMITLGILTIAIPLGTNIVASIVYAIMKAVLENVASFDSDLLSGISISLGLMFVVVGLLCRYGAENKAPKEDNNSVE